MARGLVLIGILSAAPIFASTPAAPGTLNYKEGEVSIGAGHSIHTGNGMAEVLLSTGSILRLDNRTEVTFSTLWPAAVQAALEKGEAMIEVLHVPCAGSVIVEQNGVMASIQKPGLYDFDRNRGTVSVYDGLAQLSKGAKQITLGKGFRAKTRSLRKFQTAPDTTSPLYAWSNFRSEQLSLESAASARTYAGNPSQWSGPAWYWDPWSSSYTYLSASGFVNGPFGWPFYAPGHSHNYIPEHRRGDSYLYGPPVPAGPGAIAPAVPYVAPPTPAVPLTAPGVPSFPNSRFGRP